MGQVLQLIAHLLRFLTIKIDQIMATLEELSAKADLLQQTIDNTQAAVAKGTADMANSILDLRAQLANGTPNPSAIQAIADKLDASIADLATTVVPSVPQ